MTQMVWKISLMTGISVDGYTSMLELNYTQQLSAVFFVTMFR